MKKILSFSLFAFCLSNSAFVLAQEEKRLNCEANFITSSFSTESYLFESVITFYQPDTFVGKTTIWKRDFGPHVDDYSYREIGKGRIWGFLNYGGYKNLVKAQVEYQKHIPGPYGNQDQYTVNFDLNWEYFSGTGRMNAGKYDLKCSPEF